MICPSPRVYAHTAQGHDRRYTRAQCADRPIGTRPEHRGVQSAANRRRIARRIGVDSQLLADETISSVEDGGQIVGCGGWSFRSTLFGGDARAGRDSSILDSKTQPRENPCLLRRSRPRSPRHRLAVARSLRKPSARTRLFAGGTHGDAAGRQTVRGAGLRRRTAGYASTWGRGESIEFIPMRKPLVAP